MNSELGTFTPDNLPGGSFPMATKAAVIKASAGNLVRGQVMGKITKGEVTQSYSGTGTGTLTLDETESRLANSRAGSYTVKCVEAAANGGTFEVFDPSGISLGTVTVGESFSNRIKFSIADGDTDFIVGDAFTITIAKGSGYFAAYDSASVDGSEKPCAVLLGDVADDTEVQSASVALTGQFVADELVFTNKNDSFDAIEDELRALGIFGVPATSA